MNEKAPVFRQGMRLNLDLIIILRKKEPKYTKQNIKLCLKKQLNIGYILQNPKEDC